MIENRGGLAWMAAMALSLGGTTGAFAQDAATDLEEAGATELASNEIGGGGGRSAPAARLVDDGSAPALVLDEEAERFAKNTIYLEGLGAGLLYSINYERAIEDAVGVRLGFSYFSASASAGDSEASASVLFFPITASYIGLKGLEVGGGATLMYASGSASTIGAEASGSGIAPLANLMLGYRSHPGPDGGFNFRVGAMAFFGPGLGFSVEDPSAFGVLPSIYLSLGASI